VFGPYHCCECCYWQCLLFNSASWYCLHIDIVDREVDAHVQRTKNRPIPSGRLSVRAAFILYIVALPASLIITYFILGPIPTLLCACNQAIYAIYPFTKKILAWPQLVLAPAVGWPALVGWTSIMGNTERLSQCLPLFLAVSAWSIYFDTAYGSQDAEDDVYIGVSSLAVWMDNNIRTFLGVLGSIVIVSGRSISRKISNYSIRTTEILEGWSLAEIFL